MKSLTKVVMTVMSIGAVLAPLSAAATGAQATQKGYAHIKKMVPQIIAEYKQETGLSDADKVARYRVLEAEFIDTSKDKAVYSRYGHAMDLAIQFWGEHRPWRVNVMKDTLAITADNKEKISGIASSVSFKAKRIKDLIEFSKGENVSLPSKFSREGLEAVHAYLMTLKPAAVNPLAKKLSPKTLCNNVSVAVSEGYTIADKAVRPKGQASIHKIYDSKKGNVYIAQDIKTDILGTKYVANEFRFTIPPAHADVYLYTKGFVSGKFIRTSKTTRHANGGNLTEVYSYKTIPAYVTEHRKWQKQIPIMEKFSQLTQSPRGVSDAEYLAYVDKIIAKVGAPSRASVKPTPMAPVDQAAIEAAWNNLIAVAKKVGAEETRSERERRQREEAIAKERAKTGGVARRPEGEKRDVKINIKKTDGRTIPNKYFAGRKFKVAPENNPEAYYLNQTMKYYQIHIYSFPINQPQTIAITEADGTVLFDTTIMFSPQSSYDNSLTFKIDESKLMGDGSNEQLTLALRFNNEQGNSLKSTYFKGLQVAVARKKSPTDTYIKKPINFYTASLSEVFCTDQIVSLINAEGKTIWSGEVFVDPANVSKNRQDVTFQIAEAVFTGEATEQATPAQPSNSGSSQQSTAPAKKKRGSKLKKIGRSLF